MRFGANKYRNKKVIVNGETFDSKKEWQEWHELKLLEKAGKISNLERQKAFEIIPILKTSQETIRKTIYRADFFYYDLRSNRWTVRDTKGFPTPEYKLKKKLMIWLHPEYTFVESGASYKEYRLQDENNRDKKRV